MTEGCPNQYRNGLVLALMLYLVAFSVGIGPLPWVVNAEIYALEIRGIASGIAGTTNWLTNALVSQSFLLLTNVLSPAGAFLLYAAITAVGTVWAYEFVPETKGLSLA
jgi:Sugar (and other) transporter